MSKNDERVLQLKRVIEEKKSELKSISRFSPMTNCIISLDGCNYNLNVAHADDLTFLLVKLNAYLISAKDLDIDLSICGYTVDEWITDIKSRLNILARKSEETELKTLESKLDKMLSSEKKTELELDEIAELLKG